MATVRVGEFEWDDEKGRSNLRKHGVTFEEGMTVFLDEPPCRCGARPSRAPRPHRRIAPWKAALGLFAERSAGGMIRIVSARRANKRERRSYAEED